VTPRADLKICDFGLSRAIGKAAPASPASPPAPEEAATPPAGLGGLNLPRQLTRHA
jgi:hypothetical protein